MDTSAHAGKAKTIKNVITGQKSWRVRPTVAAVNAATKAAPSHQYHGTHCRSRYETSAVVLAEGPLEPDWLEEGVLLGEELADEVTKHTCTCTNIFREPPRSC